MANPAYIIGILLATCAGLALCSDQHQNPYIMRFGRPKGGFVGHWKEDWINPPMDDPTKITGNPHVSIKWFQQKLDHFNFDSRTWTQKYWVNDQFYKPGGPIFIQLGGEGPTSRHWIDTNEGTPDWLKNAKTFGALCFLLEHRYYGDSHPMPNLTTPNLQWLSSKQALADIANFITGMNKQYGITNPKWVTFGGSYSGALSGWFRLKYPHMAVGAIATSGPVHAKVDFLEYMEVVQNSLSTYNPKCLANVASATNTIASMISNAAGRATIKQKFKLCSALDSTNSNDMMNFWMSLSQNFAYVVQYSEDNRGIFANNLTIPLVCNMMMQPGISPLDNYAAAQNYIASLLGSTCLSYKYSDMINFYRQTSFSAGDDSGRLWTYQTCTEFGYYQSSDSPNQPFGSQFPLSFILQQCQDIFGPQVNFSTTLINGAIRETNNFYGSLNFKGTNVVLPNGSTDPWHTLGVLSSLGYSTPASYMTGTAHCANMYPARLSDNPGLKVTRDLITRSISMWLR